jgi:hypothetical protein
MQVDPNIHNAWSRFVDCPEGLEEEVRCLHLNQEDVPGHVIVWFCTHCTFYQLQFFL